MSKKLKFVLPFVNDGSCPEWARIEVLAAYATPPSRRRSTALGDLSGSTRVENNDRATGTVQHKTYGSRGKISDTIQGIGLSESDDMNHVIPWAT